MLRVVKDLWQFLSFLLHFLVLFDDGFYSSSMFFFIVVLAAHATEEALKVRKFQNFWLVMYWPTTILALHLYL